MNGGTCLDGVNSWYCDCVLGYGGISGTCAVAIDECNSRPCLNLATCVDGIGKYTCQCAECFEGTTCAIPMTGCPAAESGLASTTSKALLGAGGGVFVILCVIGGVVCYRWRKQRNQKQDPAKSGAEMTSVTFTPLPVPASDPVAVVAKP